ncbi:MAG: homocysteine S-methyltransferase family protein [Paracoccaceae bacterium]
MDITLLDGSIGQELMKRSGDTPTALWSTMVMIEHPELVHQVHAEYFRVGATIATTNTYPVLQDRLDTNGYDLDIRRLWDAAIKSARNAAQSNGHGRVAGSIGPLIATYRPDICPEPADAEQQYADIVAHLAAQTDFLLIETVSSLKQAEGALRATDKTDKPVWIAFSVDDFDGSKLRSGENVSDLLGVLKNHRVDAVLVNCSRPEAVTDALEHMKSFGLPFGAYANGFTKISDGFLTDKPTVDALSERHDLGPAEYAKFAMHWIDQGATIVGGCCEVGPEHIQELAKQIKDAGHNIV